jgi:7-carboxy-7-deazaguanine synthase
MQCGDVPVMFGTNPIAEPRPLDHGFLVKEVWFTIQGEGPWMGRPAVFVRLAGCNLRCFFCDTDFSGGTHHSLTSLVALVEKACTAANTKRVVLTGGEPMLQDVVALVGASSNRLTWQVETAGTVIPKVNGAWPTNLNIVVSPKTPKIHQEIARRATAYKYIIRAGECSPDDGLPHRSTQKMTEGNVPLARPLFSFMPIYVQPCDEGEHSPSLNRANMAEAVRVSLRYGYFLSLQMHKIVGLP